MLLNIISRMLDNGFSPTRAIQTELTLRKNNRNYPKNLEKYQSLLKNNYGLLIEEYEVMGEIAFSVEILTKDVIKQFTTYENYGLSDSGCAYQKDIEINHAKETDYYFSNTILDYNYKLENNGIKIYQNYQEILIELNNLDKTLFTKFDGLENLMKMIKNKGL